jgi:hypothetical protein
VFRLCVRNLRLYGRAEVDLMAQEGSQVCVWVSWLRLACQPRQPSVMFAVPVCACSAYSCLPVACHEPATHTQALELTPRLVAQIKSATALRASQHASGLAGSGSSGGSSSPGSTRRSVSADGAVAGGAAAAAAMAAPAAAGVAAGGGGGVAGGRAAAGGGALNAAGGVHVVHPQMNPRFGQGVGVLGLHPAAVGGGRLV